MGVVNTTYTFTSTDTITSAKMNNIIDETTFTSDAIQGTTLQVVSPGKLAVSAGGITSNELASSSVTPAKLSTGGPSWTSSGDLAIGGDLSVTGDSSVTGDASVTGNLSVTGTSTLSDSLTIGTAQMPVPTGSAPIFGVRAWVNFNGTSGSTAIRKSGNVSTVTRNAVGRYTITFATAMQDTNYAIVAFARDANATDGNYFVSALSNSTKTTSSVQVEVNSPGGSVDSPEVNIMVIR
jgi:hypothetical protein